MVVDARLDYLQQCALSGDLITISVLPNGQSGNIKIKVLVRKAPELSSELIRSFTWSTISCLKCFLASCCVVDRGHKHLDGTYEVGFWAKAVSANNAFVSKTSATNINRNTSTDPSTSNTDLVGAWIPIAHRDPPLAGLLGTSTAPPVISEEAAFVFRGEVDVLRDRISVLSVKVKSYRR